MQLINGRTDILVLGMFRPDAEIGIYRVACQIAALVSFGLSIVNSVQGPHIAHLHAMGDKRRLQQMVSRSSRGILSITLLIVIAVVLLGKPLLAVAFGPAFESAYVPLVILAIGQLVSVSAGSVSSLLNMTGHERDTMQGLMIAASLNLVLNLLLTPQWGATGAAVATAVTLIVWNLILLRKVYLRTGIRASAFFRPRSQ
jgi:O-antigen/teichoic acid export membrane protein